MPRWRRSALLAAPLLLAATACATHDPALAATTTAPATPGVLRAAGVAHRDPGGVDVGPLVAGTTAFGHELYARVADPATNTVLSPVSITTAFSMLRLGARAETAAELDRVLHLPAQQRDAAVDRLVRDLVTQQGPPRRTTPSPSRRPGDRPPDPVVALANALWLQPGFSVGEPFLHTLAETYGAGARQLDFTRPDAAKAVIDHWADVQTAGRIREVFDDLSPDTKVVLANATYLKASWVQPFLEAHDADFTRADGSIVQVPTMQEPRRVRYGEAAGWQAVELPYTGGELAMLVLVPRGGTPLVDLLAPRTLTAALSGLRPQMVDLALPRWRGSTTVDLKEQLAAMGAQGAMSAGADYSGIASGLFIDQAIHRAVIEVEEQGTEAAAITAISMRASAQTAKLTVRADHPFAFAVVHTPTGTPLFLGSVADPSARP